MRWALELKGIPFEYVPVNLLKGEHQAPAFRSINPAGSVPVLEIDGNIRLSQSVAILDWIENVFANRGPRLVPENFIERAKILELCEVINSDTAPLQTPRVQKRHSSDPAERSQWAKDFIFEGLSSFAELSKSVRSNGTKYAAGDEITAADLFLIPQIYNALRYEIDVKGRLPELFTIYERCLQTVSCAKTSPEQQIDASV